MNMRVMVLMRQGDCVMLDSLDPNYHQMFFATVMGSVFVGWDLVVGCMLWLYGEGHLGFNLLAIYEEADEDGE
jgi:hypothetical protein